MAFDERFEALQSAASRKDEMRLISNEWVKKAGDIGQQYLWDWMGLPIIQLSTDIVQLQEIIFRVKPDLIIETGVARGGSLAFYASMLCLLDIADNAEPLRSTRRVLGIDIDMREPNAAAIKQHPLHPNIDLLTGSSIDKTVIETVHQRAESFQSVLVSLDSNHSHNHVFAELNAYAPLVSPGSYCIVFDTVIEDLPAGHFDDRPWDVGNNPKTAVNEWIKSHPDFEIDDSIDEKLMISVAPGGYLKRKR